MTIQQQHTTTQHVVMTSVSEIFSDMSCFETFPNLSCFVEVMQRESDRENAESDRGGESSSAFATLAELFPQSNKGLNQVLPQIRHNKNSKSFHCCQ